MKSRLGYAAGLFAMLTASIGLAPAGGLFAQSASVIGLVAIDAVPSGNTATSLGPLDACKRIEPGQTVEVDLVVDEVPEDRPFIGFEVHVNYDPALLEVVAWDHEFLLAAGGTYEPIEALSDPVPDTNGDFYMAVADIASAPDGNLVAESGPGVLARLTLRAKAAGTSEVAPGFTEENRIYPALYDTQNTTIEVDAIAGARIAIGQDCTGPAQPQPTDLPPLEELQGTPGATTPPDGSPGPGETPGGSPGPPGAGLPSTPTRAPGATPTTTPREVDIAENSDSDGAALIIAGAAVVIAGLGAAGAGGYLMYRRRARGT